VALCTSTCLPSTPARACLSVYLCPAGKASLEQQCCMSATGSCRSAFLKCCGSGWRQATGGLEWGQKERCRLYSHWPHEVTVLSSLPRSKSICSSSLAAPRSATPLREAEAGWPGWSVDGGQDSLCLAILGDLESLASWPNGVLVDTTGPASMSCVTICTVAAVISEKMS
jgi:hypothetical protein